MSSIGLACNVYNEANAISGLLENVASFFDDVVFLHAGPGGKYSTDGTIEIIQKWGARLEFGSIDEGFGVVRSRLVHMTSTEWTMILDADERFHPFAPIMHVIGSEAYPQVKEPNLQVHISGATNQGILLRQLCERNDVDAVVTARRHWFNFHWNKPCQNWMDCPDWQMRVLRNRDYIGFNPSVKMHEQCLDFRKNDSPSFARGDVEIGPFHDHYHCYFKPMEVEQRQEDIEIYNRLAFGDHYPTPTTVGATE